MPHPDPIQYAEDLLLPLLTRTGKAFLQGSAPKIPHAKILPQKPAKLFYSSRQIHYPRDLSPQTHIDPETAYYHLFVSHVWTRFRKLEQLLYTCYKMKGNYILHFLSSEHPSLRKRYSIPMKRATERLLAVSSLFLFPGNQSRFQSPEEEALCRRIIELELDIVREYNKPILCIYTDDIATKEEFAPFDIPFFKTSLEPSPLSDAIQSLALPETEKSPSLRPLWANAARQSRAG